MNADNIKLLRKQMQMKQADMGQLFGVNQSTIHQWEHGYGRPPATLNSELLSECWKLRALEKVRVKSILREYGRLAAWRFILFVEKD